MYLHYICDRDLSSVFIFVVLCVFEVALTPHMQGLVEEEVQHGTCCRQRDPSLSNGSLYRLQLLLYWGMGIL